MLNTEANQRSRIQNGKKMIRGSEYSVELTSRIWLWWMTFIVNSDIGILHSISLIVVGGVDGQFFRLIVYAGISGYHFIAWHVN